MEMPSKLASIASDYDAKGGGGNTTLLWDPNPRRDSALRWTALPRVSNRGEPSSLRLRHRSRKVFNTIRQKGTKTQAG